MNSKAISILEVAGMPEEGGIVTLSPGSNLSIKSAAGSTIACLAGSVWVTREGDRDDVILGAGESVEVRGRGRVVVTAFGEGRVRVA